MGATQRRHATNQDDSTVAALERLLAEHEREREARNPPVVAPHASSRIRPGEPRECPFPHVLLTRRFGFGGIPLSPDETARCLDARRRLPGATLERVTVTSSPVTISLPEGIRPAYQVRALRHVDVLADERWVHIEALAQTLDSPGGAHTEVRVYVDGLLEGRSIQLGRLGATVNTFPVVAVVGPRLVLTVEPVHWTGLDQVIVVA
jgi:hypothetical protein